MISNYKLSLWDPDAYLPLEDGTQNKEERLEAAVDEYTKYVLYMTELQISKLKPHPVPQEFVVLFDLEGFKPKLIFRRDVRLMILKLIYVAQAQYPERLRKAFLVNAPFGFEAAWKIIQPLLDEKTAGKIHFSTTQDLLDDIDARVLSEAYGGRHREYPETLGPL